MDRKEYAVYIELFRGVLGLALISFTGDWFGLDSYVPLGSWLVALYFLISLFSGIYFTYFEASAPKRNTWA
ncbi:hypothetical protein Q4603_13135 [Zobellia galactanivorans]|uniref:hypothetical protein n=1 Tax=Zobellia galactanivorans (strain DSM 12802 / CCUG 47099 / CIP 106680 / NCIMB 13871 / Dsij) TaxID=63186 RepID=UPI0026E416FC|nr:hypothetical protein [Zobellia galactanivorans]MDO6809567.1 hypothetical protein [Zobellia galactanivorans]